MPLETTSHMSDLERGRSPYAADANSICYKDSLTIYEISTITISHIYRVTIQLDQNLPLKLF